MFVSAPASGQGKTTVTAALAHHHRQQGRRVRVFKSGPDFLDPMILERASGAPVYQLDLWMGGEDHCRQLLYDAAAEADLILVEGVMGLFDGDRSSADLAMLFGIPILAVIDGGAMAQTFGALAHGLATYRPGLPFAGVFANRVAGERHYEMLAESLPPGLRSFGWLARDGDVALPERHLGLVQAAEVADLDARIARAAAALHGVEQVMPAPVTFRAAVSEPPSRWLAGVRIGVAQDAAFAFLYRANLDLLRALGAELTFFSPLVDATLPAADALYLPGGYPELHGGALAAAARFREGLVRFAGTKPVHGECGGFMVLGRAIEDAEGKLHRMTGLLGHVTSFTRRKINLGYRRATLLADCAVGQAGQTVRGHEFHYSRVIEPGADEPLCEIADAAGNSLGRSGGRRGLVTGAYFHAIATEPADGV